MEEEKKEKKNVSGGWGNYKYAGLHVGVFSFVWTKLMTTDYTLTMMEDTDPLNLIPVRWFPVPADFDEDINESYKR